MKAAKGAWVGAKQVPSVMAQGFLLIGVGIAAVVLAPLICPLVGASLAVTDEEKKKKFFEAYRAAGVNIAARTAISLGEIEAQIDLARQEPIPVAESIAAPAT